MTTNIVWRPVVEFPDCYEVSNTGLVRSIDRVVQNRGKPMRLRGRMMKQRIVKGYYMTCLRANGRQRYMAVHRLVASAFPNGVGPQVRHIDGIRTNNNAENLRWGTHSENMIDRDRHGTTQRGETHGKAIRSEAFVCVIRHLFAAGHKLTHIGVRLGMHKSRVSEIIKRKVWKTA